MERRKEEVEFVERVFKGCLVLTFESEEKWLAKRREFLCASDTAAILGIGFKSNQTIWEDKCDPEAVKKRAHVSPQVEMAMAKGKLSESHVRNQYMIDYGITVFDGTNMLLIDTKHLDSNGNPFMAATLDAWFMSSGENSVPTILEIKRTESWKTFGANPPLGYRAQVLKQMIVTGAKKAVLVGRSVLFGKGPYREVTEREYRFDADDPAVKRDMDGILQEEYKFWHEYVLPKKMPPLILPTPR